MNPPLLYLVVFIASALMFNAPLSASEGEQDDIKVMLLTGRSNKYHSWEGLSTALHQHLLDAGIFSVDKVVTSPTGESLDGFSPDWSKYQVIVIDYEGAEWPEPTKESFVRYMKNGGGLVTVHGADNSFPYWPEYNDMIGLGGWGGAGLHSPPLYPDDPSKHASRDESWGPRVYWHKCCMVHDNSLPGKTYHPKRHDFLMTVRTFDHPITEDLPEMWLQASDEIYSNLRGPAKNMTILATGFANPAYRGASPYNEPLLFTVDYGKGRVFHTTLGHVGAKEDENVQSVNNVSFITTFQRGVEWAATGQVSIPVPDDFPNAYETSVRASATDENWKSMLDPELSQWEVFMGVPHSTVEDLPTGTYQSDKVTSGTPMGLSNDPKDVFTTYQSEEGETVFKISGEIYGGLSTLDEFENYHFKTQMRWGDKKWEPRLEDKRDSGILYHTHGEHGAFWKVWKSSLEYQVQESDLGDFITIAIKGAKAPFKKTDKRSVYEPKAKYEDWKGYLHAEVEPDAPHGEWNTLEIYVLGDQAIHLVNGRLVMSLKDALDKEGKPLLRGGIQIQSEAAEVEYKNMKIRPIDAFPEILKQKTGL
ncbi:DUF1080 domain-containing protein [Puniceicoccaceae bacterium K14]|nr:DUF1080 domain-containing protein [Puniceicoccaceae bacterium K14]